MEWECNCYDKDECCLKLEEVIEIMRKDDYDEIIYDEVAVFLGLITPEESAGLEEGEELDGS